MAKPFDAPRPVEYPDKPAAIKKPKGSRGGVLPPGPRQLPGVLTIKFLLDTPNFLLNLHKEYGDAASFSLSGELFIAFFTPEAVTDVLVKKQHEFVKGVGFERMHKVLGQGLLTNEEPVHLRHRRMMQPPFHHGQLDSYAAQMRNVVTDHLSTWKLGQQLSATDEMMQLTFKIVAQILFSTNIEKYAAGVQHHMGIAIDRIERTMLPGLDRFDNFPLPYFRKFRESANYLADVAQDIIESRVASGTNGDDLLGLLLSARDDENQPFSQDDVRDETLTLILSGHETTANATTWALAYLRDRDDLWMKLALEAEQNLPENSLPDVKRVLSAPTAKAIFAEALRLAPPVWVSPRRALSDVEIGGIAVPKGAHVLVSQYASHRSEKFFHNPDKFLPERWENDFESSLPRGAYFPFLLGSRKCLGDQFALLEANIILLQMAREKRLRPISAQVPKAEPRATYRPKGGVPSLVTTN
jgi:cytochrome P450